MKIQVTQEDINQGVRQECEKCPIALAVIRAIGPQAATMRISVDDAWVDIGEESWCLPRSAARFVSDFDSGKAVTPFEFELTEKLYRGKEVEEVEL